MAVVKEVHLIQLRIRIQETLNGIGPVALDQLVKPELLSEAHTALTTLMEALDVAIESAWKPGSI